MRNANLRLVVFAVANKKKGVENTKSRTRGVWRRLPFLSSSQVGENLAGKIAMSRADFFFGGITSRSLIERV